MEIEETIPENVEEEKVVELEVPLEVFEEEVSKSVEQEETPPPKIREKLDLRRHVRRHRNIPRFSQSQGNP